MNVKSTDEFLSTFLFNVLELLIKIGFPGIGIEGKSASASGIGFKRPVQKL